jgi:hypothetical protein
MQVLTQKKILLLKMEKKEKKKDEENGALLGQGSRSPPRREKQTSNVPNNPVGFIATISAQNYLSYVSEYRSEKIFSCVRISSGNLHLQQNNSPMQLNNSLALATAHPPLATPHHNRSSPSPLSLQWRRSRKPLQIQAMRAQTRATHLACNWNWNYY